MFIDSKIKKELKEKLESYFEKTLHKDDFIDLELLKLMAHVTTKTGYEVAVLLNRKGKVVDIFVGNKNSVSFETISEENKLSGVRLIHTHPSGNSMLSELDKSALLNNKLDAVCAVGVSNGELTTAHVGFINAGQESFKVDVTYVHNAQYINKYGLFEKLYEYDAEFNKHQSGLYSGEKTQNRAILVAVEITEQDDLTQDLQELKGLAETAHIEVVGKISQKRSVPDGKFLIGQGKLVELKELVQNTGANLVIFDNELSGSKKRNLTGFLGVDVIDRSLLILDIFAARAQTNEGKLQVELAQLKYLLPRVGSIIKGHEGSGSGVGMRGPGESKIEINKRVIENNILKKEKELQQVRKTREVTRSSRRRSNKKVVSIVGYTNSGKSTLMNTLANANVYEKDELFATLDTTTRNVWLNNKNEILLIDTVGFINKLPHEFINAFSSTLEESVFADLLLHVVDASDKNYEKHISVVLEVLQKIGAQSPIITVFNKMDKVKDINQIKAHAPKNSVFISAKQGTNIAELKNAILKEISK